jgi:hypothetical protein
MEQLRVYAYCTEGGDVVGRRVPENSLKPCQHLQLVGSRWGKRPDRTFTINLCRNETS